MMSAPQTLPFTTGVNQGVFPMPSAPVSAAQKKPPTSTSTSVAQKKPSDNPGKEAVPIHRPSASSVAADLQKELRESFLKALHEKQEQSGDNPSQSAASTSVPQEPPKKPLHPACSIPPAAETVAVNNRGIPPTPSQPHLPSSSDPKPPNVTAGVARQGPQVSSPAPLNCLDVDRLCQQMPPPAVPPKQQRHGKTTTTNNSTAKAFTAKDLPDFLSGFDQVANTSNFVVAPSPASIQPRHGAHHQLKCSPPITSRSFDDMNQFLGTDSLQLGEAVLPPTLCEAGKGEITPPATTTATFTAESYAMFAQESAMAASQHDAYLSHGLGPFGDASQVAGSFDIDGMVRLLSEHMHHNQQDRLAGKAANRTNVQQQGTAAPHCNQAPDNKRQPYDHTIGSTKPPATTSTASASSTSVMTMTSSPGDFRVVSEPSEQSSSGAMESVSSDSNTTDFQSSSNESEGNSSDDSECIRKRTRSNSVSRLSAGNNGGRYMDTSKANNTYGVQVTFESEHVKRKRGKLTQD
jgi:hypothetical protein